jgi:hypothetical protein
MYRQSVHTFFAGRRCVSGVSKLNMTREKDIRFRFLSRGLASFLQPVGTVSIMVIQLLTQLRFLIPLMAGSEGESPWQFRRFSALIPSLGVGAPGAPSARRRVKKMSLGSNHAR